MQIKDKRVVVTGGASALGYAFCRELLRNGASTIAIIDIEEQAGLNVVDTLNREFGRNRAILFPCDVSSSADFCATFKKAINTIGGIEVLVNNVAVINESNFSRTIDVNVTAVIRSTLLGIELMQKDLGGKGGAIVNISSIAGLRSVTHFPVYSATKHAVVSFSRSFAQPYHYQRTGVRILVLCPEFTMEDPTDLPEGEAAQNSQPRKVETIAHGLLYVLRCAQNGSVWVSEAGKPVYQIQMSDTLPHKVDDFAFDDTE